MVSCCEWVRLELENRLINMRKLLKFGFYCFYYPASFAWRWLDARGSWSETRWWIKHVPNGIFTSATYASYAGWMQNQGFFSALFSLVISKQNPNIFDFGCGMGGLAPVAWHFVRDGGQYLGVDTDAASIAQCQRTYRDLRNCMFHLTADLNPFYVQKDQRASRDDGIDWPVENNSQDLVIAMSVFTHLQEDAAHKYLEKIHAILCERGTAILSFHIIRKYVNPNPTYYLKHPLTEGWSCSDPKCPEWAIGVTHDAMLKFLTPRFKILHHIEGATTGGRHPSLQDIMIVQKLPKTGN